MSNFLIKEHLCAIFCVVFFYSGKSSYGKKLLLSFKFREKNCHWLSENFCHLKSLWQCLFVESNRQKYCHINYCQSRRNTLVMVIRAIKSSRRDTKLEIFLPKNQHNQRKLVYFEDWRSGEPSKIGHYFSNKVI